MKSLILCLFFVGCFSFRPYRDQIPNGQNVRHPCVDEIWPGVGHQAQYGSGTNTQFGLDFAAAGHTWTKELCNKDSDGDGKTNGFELGDPNCKWSVGAKPENDPPSHPGICEPIKSAKCQRLNNWTIVNC